MAQGGRQAAGPQASQVATTVYFARDQTVPPEWALAQAARELGTYDIRIVNMDCIGVEDAPEAIGTSQTLVVQVLSQSAADWLEWRLKPLVLRPLQAWSAAHSACGFQTGGQNAAL